MGVCSRWTETGHALPKFWIHSPTCDAQEEQQDALAAMEEQQAGLDRARAAYVDKMSRLESVEAQQQAESQRLAQREGQIHRQVPGLEAALGAELEAGAEDLLPTQCST